MANEEEIKKKLEALEEDAKLAQEKVELYQRQIFKPILEKRREIVKDIPGFWGEVISKILINSVVDELLDSDEAFEEISENDNLALEKLKDFHVEYDDKDIHYRKVTATFDTNENVFENATLVKEYTEEGESLKVLSKTEIKYKDGFKQDSGRFIAWFASDSVSELDIGPILVDSAFPDALEIHEQGIDDDDSDQSEIDLGSEDEEEEENPKNKKRSRQY